MLSGERVLFCRERAAGFYGPTAYYFSRALFDVIPLRVFPALFLTCILYPMVGFFHSWTVFAKFALDLVLFAMANAFYAILCQNFFGSAGLASLTASLGTLWAMLFGGFLLNKSHLPPLFAWIPYYTSWFNYALEAMVTNELERLVLRDSETLNIDIPGSLILRQFGFEVGAWAKDTLLLSVMVGGMFLMGWAALVLLVCETR